MRRRSAANVIYQEEVYTSEKFHQTFVFGPMTCIVHVRYVVVVVFLSIRSDMYVNLVLCHRAHTSTASHLHTNKKLSKN